MPCGVGANCQILNGHDLAAESVAITELSLWRIAVVLASASNHDRAWEPLRDAVKGSAEICASDEANVRKSSGSNNQPLVPSPRIWGRSPTRLPKTDRFIAIPSIAFAG